VSVELHEPDCPGHAPGEESTEHPHTH
jgi:hypothetical protein